MPKIRHDGEGFISQECIRCHTMKWEEFFFTHSDGKLKNICALCEFEVADLELKNLNNRV